MAANHLEPFA